MGPTASGNLISAGAISVGERVFNAAGEPFKVIYKEYVGLKGAFHPHLHSLKDYIVDGIQVSQFTTSCHPAFAKLGLNFVRSLDSIGFPVDSDTTRVVLELIKIHFGLLIQAQNELAWSAPSHRCEAKHQIPPQPQ